MSKKETAVMQIVNRQWKRISIGEKEIARILFDFAYTLFAKYKKKLWENKSLSGNNYYNKVAMYANTM